MSKPSEVHVNKVLENILIANLQDQTDFVAGNVFSFVPVDFESGTFFKYDIADTSRREVKERAPSTESVGVDWIPSTDTYTCKEYMVHHDVDDRVAANADVGMEDRTSTGLLLTEQMLLEFELLFAAGFFTTGIWTGSTTGTDFDPAVAWNNSSGVPITNVRTQMAFMKKNTKKRPNCLVVSTDVHNALMDNAQVIALMPTTDWRIPTEADLAKAFGVEKYIVAGASYNSAAKGATLAMTDIFGSAQALLCYVNPAMSRMTPRAGAIFVPINYGGNNYGIKAWEYYIDRIHSTRYEHGMLGSMKLVSSVLGCFFTGLLS